MGALMFLQTGGEVNYKPRLFTGVDPDKKEEPEYLVLDGQQRLTTLYQVFMSSKPVETCLERSKGKTVYRYYYLDIVKALNGEEDIEDAIISISDSKIKTADIGKTIILDLRTPQDEYKNMMIPLNLIMSPFIVYKWLQDMVCYHEGKSEYNDIMQNFIEKIVKPINAYKLPVIKVLKSTSQASVCQIFENVNRGGVPLNVFELVTASLAAEGIELRQEWDSIKKTFNLPQYNVLNDISGTDFITSMTLWQSYEQSLVKGTGVKCKKKDVMALRKSVFESKKQGMKEAFLNAAKFIIQQGVFTASNLPYNTQLIPLAAIFAFDNSHNKELNKQPNLSKLANWYWCGVFGELYGSANETRYASDIKDFFAWLADDTKIPDTVERSSFQANRLLSLQTRNSAAYKGVMALILQDEPLDFSSSNKMSVATYTLENTDIHHIFPVNHCEATNISIGKYNSVINKTMIGATTNRSIGGGAPSKYIKKLIKDNNNDEAQVRKAIESHKINYDLLKADDFDAFIIDRAKKLLDLIEKATGKTVAGRDSQETINAFGDKLS